MAATPGGNHQNSSVMLTPGLVFSGHELILSDSGDFYLRCLGETKKHYLLLELVRQERQNYPNDYLGWWRFDAGEGSGTLSADVALKFGGKEAADHWRGPTNAQGQALLLRATLKTADHTPVATSAIPVFQNKEQAAAFRTANETQAQFATYQKPKNFAGTLRIVSRSMVARDAVGNFCLNLAGLCKQNGIEVALYAEHFALSMNDRIRPIASLPLEVGTEDRLIYFYSIFDPALEMLSALSLKKYCYYHGVTKPDLVAQFEPLLAEECARSLKQLPALQGFDGFAANSEASSVVLAPAIGNKTIRAIPPCIMSVAEHKTLLAKPPAAQEALKLLYVGRIKPHKKIEDVLMLHVQLRKLEPNAELHIIGHPPEQAYRDYLKTLPQEGVHWGGSVELSQLERSYAENHAYISMSEDEGFCLPVYEAMRAGLPVFAYDLPAIKEVLAGSGIIFSQKDFSALARITQTTLRDASRFHAIAQAEHNRALELAQRMNGKELLDWVLQ